MTTRRELMKAGAVLCAAAAPATSAFAATPLTSAAAYHRVAFDSRIPASLAFAAEARRLGGEVHDIRGDITGLYADHLLEQWRASPTPVAGMTAYGAMFSLELMARSAGLRLAYRGHHLPIAGGGTDHQLFGPDAVLDRAALDGADRGWARETARLVMQAPIAAFARSAPSTIAQAGAAALSMDSTVSWVLAPARA